MIPKIICWLLGHKYWYLIFTGNYGQGYNRLTLENIRLPIMEKRSSDICQRCGKGKQND